MKPRKQPSNRNESNNAMRNKKERNVLDIKLDVIYKGLMWEKNQKYSENMKAYNVYNVID